MQSLKKIHGWAQMKVPLFERNKVWYFMSIVCQQTILMKYHALFVIFEKAAKFEIVVCCKL